MEMNATTGLYNSVRLMNLTRPRFGHCAVGFNETMVIIVGGEDKSRELYIPVFYFDVTNVSACRGYQWQFLIYTFMDIATFK